MRYLKVLLGVSVMLLGVAVGSGRAQYRIANLAVSDATGVPGDTVEVVISMETYGYMGSILLDLDFDTQMFEVSDVRSVGPFADWCAIDWQPTGTGINMSTVGECDSLDIGIIRPLPSVLSLTFYVIGTQTGDYALTIPTDPVPIFAPNGDPFNLVNSIEGTFTVQPTKLSLSAETAAQGSRGTTVYLDLDVHNPEGVAALQFDLLFDDTAITVTDLVKTGRASDMDIWTFSQIEGGIRLVASIVESEHIIQAGTGSIGEMYVNLNPQAPDGEYALTFSGVTIADPLGVPLSGMIVHGVFTVVKPSAVLSLGKGAGYSGSAGINVPVSLHQTMDVASVQFDLLFDTDNLSVSGVVGSGRGQGCSFTKADITGGVRVTGTCPLGSGAGQIADILFDVIGDSLGAYPLTFANATVTDGDPLPTGVEDGQFNIVSEGTAVVTVVGAAAMVGATDNVVAIGLLNGADVSSFQMDLSFDTQALTVTDVTLTSRSNGMDLFQWSTDATGLRAALLSQTGSVVGAGDGAVLEITFDVAGDASEGSYPLTISGVVVGDAAGAEMAAQAISGALWITCGAKGDVNSDYDFNITDVVALINIIIQRTEADDCTFWKGDYNSDGQLNVLDAVAMVSALLGSPKALASGSKNATVWAEEITLSETKELNLPIHIDSQVEVLGAQLTLRYDTDALTPGTPSLAERSHHMSLASHAERGELTIVVYSIDGRALSAGNGAAVTVPFRMTSDVVEGLNFDEVVLAGPSGQPIGAGVRQISLSSGVVPKGYALFQNCPNPFNPETKIAFTLPKNCQVELSIYNLLGQRVATLVDTEMAAGQHEVSWTPGSVPTGVYFYTIKASGFRATKKMVLLK